MSPNRWPNPFGPVTDEEVIIDAAEWAYRMLKARDEMNAAVHCQPVRLSPVTEKVRVALGLLSQRLDIPLDPTL